MNKGSRRPSMAKVPGVEFCPGTERVIDVSRVLPDGGGGAAIVLAIRDETNDDGEECARADRCQIPDKHAQFFPCQHVCAYI